jgi:hypothetical protein
MAYIWFFKKKIIRMYYSPVKKKIRGWKRRIRHIEKWAKNQKLDSSHFEQNHFDYVKVRIDPFYRLEKRNPPVWFQRLILKELLKIYYSWNLALKGINEKYSLVIWLYEQRFILSQIVAAKDYRIKFYENTFNKTNELRNFPLKKFKHPELLRDFNWELHLDEDWIDIENNKVKPIKLGYVWVGKYKNF